MKTRRFSVKTVTTIGIFAALSVVLVWLVHFPIFPAATFLEFDIGDIPILIVTFFYGPLSGLILTLIVTVVQGLTVSAQSGLYGILMHFISTGVYVITAGLIYKYRKNRASKIVPITALGCGCIAMTAAMAGANMIITPIFMNVPASAVASMLLPVIMPFNLIKSVVNGIVTYFIYKPISNYLHGRQL